VRACLLDQARTKGWHVVAQTGDLSVGGIVDRVRSRLPASAVTDL
jgi:hypothetical protein